MEHAYARIHESIVSGELRPGAVLKQRELGRDIGVTTTPVREALYRLEGEGLIENGPAGLTVIPLTEAGIVGHHTVRVAIETQAVRLFVKCAADDELARLRARGVTCDAVATARAQNNGEYAAAEIGFHRTIVRGAGCDELIREFDGALMKYMLRRAVCPVEGPIEGAGGHEHLASVISDRDPERAQAALRTHLAHFLGYDVGAFRRARAAARTA